MTHTERIKQILVDYTKRNHIMASSVILEQYAEELVNNGVIAPPAKMGQTAYKVYMGEISEVKVSSITYEPLPAFTYVLRFDKSLGAVCLMSDGSRNEKFCFDVFLTREEAEKSLEKG